MSTRHPNCIYPLCGCGGASECQSDPLNMPLPCAITVGGGTFGKGVKLGAFVDAARRWHRGAFPDYYTLTDEQKAANLAVLQGATPAPQAIPQGAADCPACKGAGERDVFDTTQGPYGETFSVDCPACNGTGAATVAAVPVDEAAAVCAEAYQVVGVMLSDLGIWDEERAEKLLDNLSAARMVHDDVLPWESVAASPAVPAAEPGDCIHCGKECCNDFGWCNSFKAAPAAPAEDASQRTPKDYAIEHAGYLATAAKDYRAAVNAELEANAAADDADSPEEHDDAQSAIDRAIEAVGEAGRRLESCIYEFEKRRDRAIAAQAKGA